METNPESKNETVKVDAVISEPAVTEVKDTPSQPAEPTPAAETKTEQPVPSNPAPKPANNPAPVQPKPQPRANPEPKPDKYKPLVEAVKAMLERYRATRTVNTTDDYKYPGMREVAIALAGLKD
jgi:hypothetical protein